jgi:CRISPR-associated protein Csx17
MVMPETGLAGCTPEPLMGYLKALGVFRLVAEQADPDARCEWSGGVSALQSKLDRLGLIEFFLNRYRPTPILAPWNGGSGFYGSGVVALNEIEKSKVDRLKLYRDTITQIRSLIPNGKPKDADKELLLVRCRAELPDAVVPWLDTCFVLSESGPGYFPLLGTGGNDGRLDFTNNFMQRLGQVISLEGGPPPTESEGWLTAALWAEGLTSLDKAAIGQFNPGGIGGANGVQGRFDADSRVNPWDFVLMIEGALLFAGSVARRLGANAPPRAVFPFSVESIAVGYGSATASEETSGGSRSELWLPIWEQPASLAEVRHLFAEGRAQLGRRQARNAVEFALATNLLGVSRGVKAFTRYGFLKRNGLAYLAAPLGRVPVTPRPAARLLNDPPLTAWIDRLRSACRDKEKTPARYQTGLRQIDRAMFGFANRSEQGSAADRRALVNVLAAVGRAERTFASGLRFCADKYIRPLQDISAQWLDQADDSPTFREFRLATAVAGVRPVPRTEIGLPRVFLEPVKPRGTGFNWDEGSTSAVWSNRSLAANLAAVFRRRQMEAYRAGLDRVPLTSPRPAPLADVIAFLRGETDDQRLADLLWALTAIDWSSVESRWTVPADPNALAIPFEYGVSRLLVEPISLTARGAAWRVGTGDGSEVTQPDPEVFHALASGQTMAVVAAVDRAARRLKSGGLVVVGYRNRRQSGRPLAVTSSLRADRLLAAMLFPLSPADVEAVANAVLYPPETTE